MKNKFIKKKELLKPISNIKSLDFSDEIIPKIKICDEEKNLITEGINNIIHEYLVKRNLLKTIDVFQKEIVKVQDNIPINFDNKLLDYYENGQMDNFFLIWSKYVPLGLRLKDISTIEIEFFINVYFCIFNKKLKPKFEKFKDYLKLQGDELSKVDSLLPYFALPYVKTPEKHPIFKRIYTDEWKDELKKKLVTFINSLYSLDSEPFIIHIYQYYLKNTNKNEDIKEDEETKNIDSDKKDEYINYINELEHNNNYLLEVVKHYNQKSKEIETQIEYLKNEKFNSLEIQKKWALFSDEILSLCNNIYNFSYEYKENNEESINKFKSQINDFKNYLEINKNDLNMKEENKQLEESLDLEYSKIKNSNMKQKIRSSLYNSKEYSFIGINFEKLKINIYNKENLKHIINSLNQLLNKTLVLRRIYILLFAKYDLFDFENNNDLFIKLLLDNDIKEFFLKFINNMCSDYEGRSYIIKSEILLINLINIVKFEKEDNSIRSNTLAIIQKISLRVQRVKLMIDNNIIETIISFLLNFKELSEYSLEYSLALILNLSLRRDAIEICNKNKNDILIILIKIQNNCTSTVRNFINGTLFSLLKIKEIKNIAIELKLKDELLKNYNNLEEVFQKQINYIIEKIESDIANDDENYLQEYDSDNFNIHDNINDNSILNNSQHSIIINNNIIETDYNLNIEDEKNQLNEIKPLIENRNNKEEIEENDINDKPLDRPTTPSIIYYNKKKKYNENSNPFTVEELDNLNEENINKNTNGNEEWKNGFLPRPKIPRTPMIDLNNNINKI